LTTDFLLRVPEAIEVMVNGPGDAYVERRGRIDMVRGLG
jgi:hypothetical protein